MFVFFTWIFPIISISKIVRKGFSLSYNKNQIIRVGEQVMLQKERIKKVNLIFETELKDKQENEHIGEIIALEIPLKNIFLGKNEIEAY